MMYQPYYTPYPQMQQPITQAYQQPTQQPVQQQNYQQTISQAQQSVPIQNGGFAIVRSEQEARDYLLAPGTFMTFKNENSQYMYEKSRTFSQLDAPTFKKFRLVEEDDTPEVEVVDMPNEQYALERDFLKLIDDVTSLKDEVDLLREQMREPKRTTKTKKENADE